MPIYEYVCEQCEKMVDVLQKVNDPPPGRCESCGAEGKMRRRVSRTSFVLKGSGWYSDLYSSPKKDTPKDAAGNGASGGSAGTKEKSAEGSSAASSPAPSSTEVKR